MVKNAIVATLVLLRKLIGDPLQRKSASRNLKNHPSGRLGSSAMVRSNRATALSVGSVTAYAWATMRCCPCASVHETVSPGLSVTVAGHAVFAAGSPTHTRSDHVVALMKRP